MDWYRASINLDLDDFDASYIDAATSATCPSCGHKVYFESLMCSEGVFYVDDGRDTHESVRDV
jgi:hypothetical protein